MERSMKQYDKEYMKTAILKHEQTFREQVSELHRLYRVQKMLMRDMKRNAPNRPETTYGNQNGGGGGGGDRWHAGNNGIMSSLRGRGAQGRLALDLERPAEEYMEDNDDDCGDTTSELEDESEIELTLATGRSRRRKKEETSLTSESGASFSSSSTESGGENLKLQDWGLFQFAGVNGSFPGEKKSGGEYRVEAMRQDHALKQPPWLFQCLSLNMT